MQYTKPPLYLYFDTATGEPRKNRAPDQPVEQYVNLKNLWHKPDEIPAARTGILVFNDDKDIRFVKLTNAAQSDWKSFASFSHIHAWMYADDLFRTIPITTKQS